jgi:hypothetical protein
MSDAGEAQLPILLSGHNAVIVHYSRGTSQTQSAFWGGWARKVMGTRLHCSRGREFQSAQGVAALLGFFGSVWRSRGLQPLASFLRPFRGAVESFASGAAGRELEAVRKSELAFWM